MPRPEDRLAAARGRYLATLDGKAQDLLRAADEGAEPLRALAHRLAGSAGLHRLADIEAQARHVESLCRDAAPGAALVRETRRLARLLQSAAAGASAPD